MRIVQEALTFDDVLLLPAYSEVLPTDVSLKTQLTRAITLNIPLVSAAMDTVTESRLAIALAQEGGIGIIHKNMPVEKQAQEVRRVKKFESGVISDPIVTSPSASIRDVVELTRAHHISGVPVVDGEELVGIVTNRDLRFEHKMDAPVSTMMTPRERLVTVREGASREEVVALLHRASHRESAGGQRTFSVTWHDHGQGYPEIQRFPACLQGRSGAGYGPAPRSARGATLKNGLRRWWAPRWTLLSWTRRTVIPSTCSTGCAGSRTHYPQVQVIGGNIATAAAARDLVDAGADAVKVGIGPGSICTTRIIAGVGVPADQRSRQRRRGVARL